MDLFKNKDYEKAVQYFRAAVGERPDYWQAYQFLGESYFQAANRTEAAVAIEESLRLHPHNPELRKFLRKLKSDSPWASRSALPFIALCVSLLTLLWTGYLSYRTGVFKRKAP
jgi:tetratricopeptide (TPR) repeat protein